MPVFQLNDELIFPPAELAEKDGLLAVGGDLSPERVVLAYRQGIFPWYSPEDPILWWSPNPRLVLYPDRLHIASSMRQVINKGTFEVTFDRDFGEVMRQCGLIPRKEQDGTWITPEMLESYQCLHEKGIAHSVEVWKDEELVGGLYGLWIGRCFFGESMFSKASNASKTGFIHLVHWLRTQNCLLIDCQVSTSHLQSLGAEEISRMAFLEFLEQDRQTKTDLGPWEYQELKPLNWPYGKRKK